MSRPSKLIRRASRRYGDVNELRRDRIRAEAQRPWGKGTSPPPTRTDQGKRPGHRYFRRRLRAGEVSFVPRFVSNCLRTCAWDARKRHRVDVAQHRGPCPYGEGELPVGFDRSVDVVGGDRAADANGQAGDKGCRRPGIIAADLRQGVARSVLPLRRRRMPIEGRRSDLSGRKLEPSCAHHRRSERVPRTASRTGCSPIASTATCNARHLADALGARSRHANRRSRSIRLGIEGPSSFGCRPSLPRPPFADDDPPQAVAAPLDRSIH